MGAVNELGRFVDTVTEAAVRHRLGMPVTRAALREIKALHESRNLAPHLRLAERRVAFAVREIVDGAPPPRRAVLHVDGPAAYFLDHYAREAVERWRAALKDYREGVPHPLEGLARKYKKEADERRAARAEARQAAAAEERDLRAEVEALRAEVEALRAAPAAHYAGTWQSGREYARGTLVTDRGTLWYCRAERTKARPGGGDEWQLTVKAGRMER